MIDDRMPILVGGGQFTQRTAQTGKLEESLDPVALLVEASQRAAKDTGLGARLWSHVDTVSVVRFTADTGEGGRLPVGQYTNPPRSLSKRLGFQAAHEFYTAVGGNTPQWLVNRTADAIWQGEQTVALLAGSEDLATMIQTLQSGKALDWGEDAGGEPTLIGEMKPGVSKTERAHAMHYPVNVYPLFEQAIRKKRGLSVRAHQAALGRLFAPFSAVAAGNPDAWFPKARSAEEIATPGPSNRTVGFPYTKYMNAIIQVDQSAAVVMTNVKTARALGIAPEKWVFLHGGAEGNDIWNVSERIDFHSSPAIRRIGHEVFGQAGKSISDVDFFDLYSCFPSAVEIGAAELGIAEDDPRGLTVTGGLPYFGGAGNNYVMHSIVTMMARARAKPGSFGLVTANGWFITKHAAGLYSTAPKLGAWTRTGPQRIQADLDAMAHPVLDATPNGPGVIETYTVVHDRDGPSFALILGRMGDRRRFIAHSRREAAVFAHLMQHDCIGATGQVTPGEKTNTFEFA